jgi:hypothetical protein
MPATDTSSQQQNPAFDSFLSNMSKMGIKPDPEDAAKLESGRKKVEEALAPTESASFQLPPKPENRDPLDTFGSAAGWIATFGSLLTRHPLTSALESSAAAMNAVKQADTAANKAAIEKWKENNTLIMDRAKFEMEAYKNVKTDAEMHMLGQAYGNPTAVTMARLGMGKEYAKNYEEMFKMFGKHVDGAVGAVSEKMEKASYVRDSMEQWNKDHPNATKLEQDRAKLGFQSEATNIIKGDESVGDKKLSEKEQTALDNDAKDWAKGVPIAQLVRGQGKYASQRLEQIKERAAELGLNTDRSKSTIEYSGKQSETRGEQGAIGRRSGTTEVGVGEFDQLIEPTRKAIHKLDLGSFKDYNSFIASYDTHVNDPDYIEAFDRIQELQNAYTAVLVRGGQRSDAAQALSEHTINTLFGVNGSDRALDTMADNTKRIMKGIEKAKEGAVGAPPKAAIEHLKSNPSLKDAFDQKYGEGASDKYLEAQ